MKNLTIDKNPVFRRYEREGRTLTEILNNQKDLRFDLTLADEEKTHRTWRANIRPGEDSPILQLKDFTGVKTSIPLYEYLTLSEISAVALNYVWQIIDGVGPETSPPTGPMKVLDAEML